MPSTRFTQLLLQADSISRNPARPKRVFAVLGMAFAWLALALATPFEVGAVLIATGNGSGNTTPPSADPGFDNVGTIEGKSGVYLGNGWVLTAAHVGVKPITLSGVTYAPVPFSNVSFQNPDQSFADLVAYKLLDAKPPLPDVAIADSPPTQNLLVTLIGNGLNRGDEASWSSYSGWEYDASRTLRWGTNRISIADTTTLNTEAFWMHFDEGQPPGQHEADVGPGDSGGAVFSGSGGTAELVGILFAHATYAGQPHNTYSLFGNAGIAVDLFAYRSEILATIAQPDCSDNLDDDGDGLVDFPADPGCSSALDTDERGSSFECDNGIDDDGDTLVDFPNDVQCYGATDATETLPVPTGTFGPVLLTLGLLTSSTLLVRAPRSDAQSSSTRSTR